MFKSKMVVTVTEAVLSLGGGRASVGPRNMGRSTHRRQGRPQEERLGRWSEVHEGNLTQCQKQAGVGRVTRISDRRGALRAKYIHMDVGDSILEVLGAAEKAELLLLHL